MKPGPSSERLFSKCTQSTMSCSSLTQISLAARTSGLISLRRLWRKSVNLSLAAAVERILWRTKGEPQRHRPELEIAPHRVEKIAVVAFRQFRKTVAENHKAGRPRFHLSDVAEFD